MKYILYPEKYLEIMLEHPFICFSCTCRHNQDSLIQPRGNVDENLVNYFLRSRNITNIEMKYKFPLRVFAPFDGISGCMYHNL